MNNWKLTALFGTILVLFAYLVASIFNTSLDHVMIWVLFCAYLSHIDSKYAHAENKFRKIAE